MIGKGCLKISVHGLHAPEGINATHWLPGTEAIIKVGMVNSCDQALMGYPSGQVVSSDARVQLDNAAWHLYGLGPGQEYPLEIKARADAAIASGTKVTLVFTGRAEMNGQPDPPIPFEVEIGAALANKQR
jgi:hypothetical protein